MFNWCSSVLISITGAVLAAGASDNFRLTTPGRILVSVVVVIVTIYASAWIAENLRFEKISGINWTGYLKRGCNTRS